MVISYTAKITRSADEHGFLLDTLHVRADEAEFSPSPEQRRKARFLNPDLPAC